MAPGTEIYRTIIRAPLWNLQNVIAGLLHTNQMVLGQNVFAI